VALTEAESLACVLPAVPSAEVLPAWVLSVAVLSAAVLSVGLTGRDSGAVPAPLLTVSALPGPAS
jgi:hypothetical protein